MRMKLLQFTQNILEIVGIDSTQNPFNPRIMMIFSIFCGSIISPCVFLFHDANNFLEYANSIYLTTATMLITTCYIILIASMEDTFELIDNFECTIDKRMGHPVPKVIYENGNRQAEKWSSIIFTVVVKVTPISFLLPEFIASIFEYLTTDLGNDAFNLPFPLCSLWGYTIHCVYLRYEHQHCGQHLLAKAENSQCNVNIPQILQFACKCEPQFRCYDRLAHICGELSAYSAQSAFQIWDENSGLQRCQRQLYGILASEAVARCTKMAYICAKSVVRLSLCSSLVFRVLIGLKMFVLKRFPFDWKNPIGYIVVISSLYISATILLISVACMGCLAVSVFLILLAFINDARTALNSLKLNLNAESGGERQMMEELLDFIKLQLMAKQAVHDASNISQPFLMALFTWSVVTTCITMLMLQIELSQPEMDAFVILLTILFACYSFGMLFIACEIGHRLTTDFIEINDTFERIDWYRYPDGIQRMLTTILINLQEPVELFYYGVNSCSRESMKKVYNTGLSYFMMLRKLDE